MKSFFSFFQRNKKKVAPNEEVRSFSNVEVKNKADVEKVTKFVLKKYAKTFADLAKYDREQESYPISH